MEIFLVVTKFVPQISFYDLLRADFSALRVVATDRMQSMSTDKGNLQRFHAFGGSESWVLETHRRYEK